jgi:ankyrin repeat protein
MGTIEKFEAPEYLCGENQWDTDQNLELYNAASVADLDKLQTALSKGANPNFFYSRDENSGVLHAAARNLSNEAALCAKELIRKGAMVSAAVISNRNTPIHEAASSGAKQVCEVLIESSPTCTGHENSFGNTALHAAARSGNPEIVRLLLQNKADLNKQNHRGSTALHIACFLAPNDLNEAVDPYIKIAAILLSDENLEVDLQDVNGYTALHIAAQRGCNEMVKLLIDSGASLTVKTDIDSKGRGGRTPECMAKFGGYDTTATLIKDLTDAIDNGEYIVTKKMASLLA